MYSQGRITQSEYEAAMKESATMTFVGYSYNDDEDEDTTQSWYNDMLLEKFLRPCKNLNISESEAERKLYTEGLKIYSAMDPTAQSIAQKKVLQWKTPKDKKLECGYIMMGLDGRVLATIGSRKERMDYSSLIEQMVHTYSQVQQLSLLRFMLQLLKIR